MQLLRTVWQSASIGREQTELMTLNRDNDEEKTPKRDSDNNINGDISSNSTPAGSDLSVHVTRNRDPFVLALTRGDKWYAVTSKWDNMPEKEYLENTEIKFLSQVQTTTLGYDYYRKIAVFIANFNLQNTWNL